MYEYPKHAKGAGYQVGQSFAGRDTNHAWVMVTIGGRQFIFDPTWASGHVNNKKYVQKFVEHYWMADPELMKYNHLPENEADQLLSKSVTREQFEDFAYFRPTFFRTGLSPHSANARVGQRGL